MPETEPKINEENKKKRRSGGVRSQHSTNESNAL
jgi:hypothetical protein